MSDESAEKRFDATPARRERAKREGNAARSHEVASIAGFAGALLGLVACLPLLTGAAASAVLAAARRPLVVDPLPLLTFAAAAFVPAACAGLAGGAISLAQTGGLRVGGLKLAFGKLAPLPGLKRMLGPEALVAAARAGLAFIAVVAVVVPIGVRTLAAASASASPAGAAGTAWAGMLHACFAAAAVGGVFALADFALARGRWLHSLKMTFDEFKRDAKEQDGDPHARSRRKQLHRTLVRGGDRADARSVVRGRQPDPHRDRAALRAAGGSRPRDHRARGRCDRARRARDRRAGTHSGRGRYRARASALAQR